MDREIINGLYKSLDDKKAEDIKVIEISNLSEIADYFVIATANNIHQMEALQDAVEEYMYKAGINVKSIEGQSGKRGHPVKQHHLQQKQHHPQRKRPRKQLHLQLRRPQKHECV